VGFLACSVVDFLIHRVLHYSSAEASKRAALSVAKIIVAFPTTRPLPDLPVNSHKKDLVDAKRKLVPDIAAVAPTELVSEKWAADEAVMVGAALISTGKRTTPPPPEVLRHWPVATTWLVPSASCTAYR
jgi:hypothetical protein